MVNVTEQEKKEIYDLYFNQFYNYSKLERHFKGKFTYPQLRDIIRDLLSQQNGTIESQSKFYNKDYLLIRLSELPEARTGKIKFSLEESNRTFSRSLYISCYTLGAENKWVKQITLRISDHLQPNCPHLQFLADPNKALTKKVKQHFTRLLDLLVNKSMARAKQMDLKKLCKNL